MDPVVLCSGHALVAVDDAEPTSVDALREALMQDFSLDRAIGVLASDGVLAMPGFVCAELVDDAARVLVRGSLSVRVVRGDDELLVEAPTNVATWREELIENVDVLRLQSGERQLAEYVLSRSAHQTPSGLHRPVTVRRSPNHRGDDIRDSSGSARSNLAEYTAVEGRPQLSFASIVTSEREPPTRSGDRLDVHRKPNVRDTDASDNRTRVLSAEDPVGPDYIMATPTVQARHCQSGHPNPAELEVCRVCSAPLDSAVTTISRPSIATLHFDNGTTIEIDRPHIIGRQPSLPEPLEGNEEVPRLIFLQDPDQDLSRNHLSITVQGWELLATDLGSTNGTMITHPGEAPIRAPEHEAVPLVVGSTATLGEVISFVVEAPGS